MVRRVQDILELCSAHGLTIGVITPYVDQVGLIQHKMDEAMGPQWRTTSKIDVGTCDSFEARSSCRVA